VAIAAALRAAVGRRQHSRVGTIRIDSSRLPLLHVVYDGGVTDQQFEEYLNEYTALLDRGQPYAAVFDASKSASPSGDQRRSQARWMRQHRVRLRELCIGGAFVITNSIIRGAFTAILWLQPLPFDHYVVRSEAEAKRWAIRRLHFHQVKVPPDLLEMATPPGGFRSASMRPPTL
jgi:hypothetical protein